MLQLTNKIDNTVSVTVKAVSINQGNFDITKARMISIMPFKGGALLKALLWRWGSTVLAN